MLLSALVATLSPGSYTVVVANSAGVVTSSSARLNASSDVANPSRIINLSILTPLAADETMTMGTVLGGGTSGNKPLLARAAGPALAQLGVTDFLPDPTMRLNYTTPNPAVVVATNNDWGGDPAITQTANRVGAFAVSNGSSKDTMLLVTLAPGNYTAQVGPVNGTAGGSAIVEVYEVP